MDRRRLLTGFLMLGAVRPATAQSSRSPDSQRDSHAGSLSRNQNLAPSLKKSGPVKSRANGQVIENLDIDARDDNAITVTHKAVTIRNCRIRHAGGHGIYAVNSPGLVLHDIDIDHVGAPSRGYGPDQNRNNVNVLDCPAASITRIRAARGASNIYVEASPDARLSFLELYDARGPMPRGQNVQFNQSPNSLLEDFSGENGPSSWTEDNVSVFRSNGCIIRRGLVFYNNSPTGDGIMLEGSSGCLVEDVDAVQQGNGAFAAVPQEDVGSGSCRFHRCRTRDTYNAPRDGRAAPTSNGLSIYTFISDGSAKHTIMDCVYYNLANPNNLIWDLKAVNDGWSFKSKDFLPRDPIRLRFSWEVDRAEDSAQ